MLSTVKSMTLSGLEGDIIEIQTYITGGLPGFELVGLPDASVREAKERVKAAIKNTEIKIPSRKFIINLAPADKRKEGSYYDLPIAVGMLTALGEIKKEPKKDMVFIGELSLNGEINRVNGILPMCIQAIQLGADTIVIPKENEREASIVKGINIICVKTLKEVIQYLNGNLQIKIIKDKKIDIKKNASKNQGDFSEVKGQYYAKRALEIAAAGMHNCLMIGGPGGGKTMMAKRLPSILPDLSFEEALEITKIYSIAGELKSDIGLMYERPFRHPHHTITSTSIIGGGKIPKPGEISLAHFGVLFLDELTEFNKKTLELLREPLEDKKVTISRVNCTLTYPCNFMFIASMNPCPCGYYGVKGKECTCSEISIRKYLNKISGPLLDRIDIHIDVEPVKYKELENKKIEESSKTIRKRVNKARKIQEERYKNYDIFSNSELTPTMLEKYCKIDDKCKKVLEKIFNNLGLSARAYSKILKLGRTIADLDNKENIEEKHLIEAIGYRSLDKRYGEKV